MSAAAVAESHPIPSDVIALVVLWRLRYRLTLRDLAEMFLLRGIVFSHEAVRDWEAKLAPVLSGELRRRHDRDGARGRRWHVDETYLKVRAAVLICNGQSTATAIWSTPCSASTATCPPTVVVCFTSVVLRPCSAFSRQRKRRSSSNSKRQLWREL